jgi:uncharacterized protein YdcH (DUF465 family)
MVDDAIFEKLLDERNELIRKLKLAEDGKQLYLKLYRQYSNKVAEMEKDVLRTRKERGETSLGEMAVIIQ